MSSKIHPTPNPNLVTGLAMTGGLGLTLAVIALGLGVIDPNANTNLVGLAVLTGIVMLVAACVAWFFVVEPHKHFDDINVPAQDEHHPHETHADDAHSEVAH